MKTIEIKKALDQLDEKVGKDASETLIKVIDMINLESTEELKTYINDRFNEQNISLDTRFNAQDQKINSMPFKIVALIAGIVATLGILIGAIFTIIKQFPQLIQ